MSVVNWEAVRDEAVRHLQNLLRIDTSNPPGNERPAAEYLARVMQTEGLSPTILYSAPGRANLVLRMRGSGAQPPLLIMSHLDTVPAGDPGQWTQPPFAGNLVDGFVWGRGAVDTKQTTVADLMTLLLIHRHRLPLRGDLTMLAHADEESDFTCGMAWLVRHHRDLFDAPQALYEGGQEITVAGKGFIVADTAEKGWCTVQVNVAGRGGHSSVPHRDQALFHLAPILHRLATRPLPVHVVGTVARYFRAIADHVAASDAGTAAVFRALADPATAEAALPLAPEDQRTRYHALLRNTATPTLLQSGHSRWAIPVDARLTLNGRLLPGQTAEDFDRELRQVLGPDVDYEIQDAHEGCECDADAPLLQAIRQVGARWHPDRPLLAGMTTGGTERGMLHRLGINVYGFRPLRNEPGVPSIWELAHGPDERISVDNLLYVVRSTFEVVCAMNGIPVEQVAGPPKV